MSGFDHAPRPDFMIIGAMKCGTSTLAAQLGAQAGVFMTTPKEPNYFSDDAIFARGPDWYADLFAAAAPGDIKGEASTHYTKLPSYPQTLERMQAALVAPKLIYMIRNPVARAVSHYIHGWSESAMGDDPAVAFAQHPEITDYGRYGMQIAPFVAAYGASAIHLTSLEQVTADSDAEFARIAGFLGLPPGACWQADLPAQNVSSERMRRLPLQGLLIDNPVAAALRRTFVPKGLRDRIRRSRTIRGRPEMPHSERTRLENVYRADRAELARHFPDHPALTLCYPFAA